MKINFHKSEVIVMGVEVEEEARVARILNCKQGKFPFTHLGFTMSDHKLSILDNEPLVAIAVKELLLGKDVLCLQLLALH
jgi:hypothetical protein